MLQVQVAMMDASTEPPGSGVSWTKGSASYTLLANYSGAPPTEKEGPQMRKVVEGPNGGGGGWVSQPEVKPAPGAALPAAAGG